VVAGGVPEGDSSQFDGITQRLRAGLTKCRRFAPGHMHSSGGVAAQKEKQVPLRLRRFGMTRYERSADAGIDESLAGSRQPRTESLKPGA
jgi:hypothetical protein